MAGFATYPRHHRIPLVVCALLLSGSCSGSDTIVGSDPDPDPVPSFLSLSKTAVVFHALSQTEPVTATVRDQKGSVMSTPVAWSSSNAEVASVSASGVITSQGNGVASVTASAGSITATVAVTVQQQAASMTASPVLLEFVTLGDTARITHEVRDPGGALVAGNAAVFGSSDTGVASVDGEGLVTARGNGSALITVAAGGLADSVSVTVTQVPAGLTASPATLGFASLGDTASIVAVVADERGHPVEGVGVSFASTNVGVATVDSRGVVEAVDNGTTEVVVVAADFADTVSVIVTQVVTDLSLQPSSLSFGALGDTASVAAVPVDARGNPVATSPPEYTSAQPSIASVASSGRVTAVGNGSTEITVSSGPVSALVPVTVAQVAAALELATESVALTGLGSQFDAAAGMVVRDRNGYPMTASQVVWSSSDLGIAGVSPDGVVSVTGPGAAVVRAVSGALSDSVFVTTETLPATLMVSPTLDTLVVGSRGSFDIEVLDGAGNALDPASVACQSIEPAVAAVGTGCMVDVNAQGLGGIEFRAETLRDTVWIAAVDPSGILATAYADGMFERLAAPGDELLVAIRLDMAAASPNGDLGAAQFDLEFDPAVIEVIDASVNGAFLGEASVSTNAVTMAVITTAPAGTPDLELGLVRLRVRPSAQASAAAGLNLRFTAPLLSTGFEPYPDPVPIVSRIQLR